MLAVFPNLQKHKKRIHGFAGALIIRTMKLNLVEINKLTPPGLWDLGLLVSVIAMLRGALRAHAGHVSALLYGRMIVSYSESLRERTRDNLNMRIKAWVMLCPVRIARVRNIIGERAIRRWHKNRLADYALTKYFGDWRRKWPDGFGGGLSGDMRSRRQAAPIFNGQPRAYNWKLFALVKIVNVHRLLYGKHTPIAEEREMQDAHYKLWGVARDEVEASTKGTQPRARRTLKPIRFTPYELEVEPDAETEMAQSISSVQNAPKRIEVAVQPGTKTGDKPPVDKPP